MTRKEMRKALALSMTQSERLIKMMEKQNEWMEASTALMTLVSSELSVVSALASSWNPYRVWTS